MKPSSLKQETEAEQKKRIGMVRNPYLENCVEDVLFHLELSGNADYFHSVFGDVKFVCMGGTVVRMQEFAEFIKKETKQDVMDFMKCGQRFSMFKVGPVLCVNHGIGYASITIVLHEIIKLLHYASVKDPIIFRIGTSGGVGIASGTVIIAEKAINDYLEEYFEIPILGEKVKIPAILNEKLAADLKNISKQKNFSFPVLSGKTMSHQHFYESVASIRAAFCDRNDDDRKKFFNLLKVNNILNADMEAVAVASLTNQLGIKSAILNVVVNDLLHPAENISTETLKEWQTRPQEIVAAYIKDSLKIPSSL